MKRFFGIRFLSGKLPSDTGGQIPRLRVPAKSGKKWKQTAFLVAVASFFFVAATEHELLAINNVSNEKLVAALKNPLSLFADRSPGERGAGPLRLTKSGPHERVLASVRERTPPGPITSIFSSGPNTAAGPETIPAGANAIPDAFSQPLDIGRAPFTPVAYSDTPIGYPGSPGDTPPDGSGGTRPGGDSPPTAGLPEPAAWTLMAFGLFAVTGIARQRQPKQTA